MTEVTTTDSQKTVLTEALKKGIAGEVQLMSVIALFQGADLGRQADNDKFVAALLARRPEHPGVPDDVADEVIAQVKALVQR